MYLSTVRAADAPRRRGTGARVSGTVFALGAVSLVTDASAEMVTAVLPMYLMYGLGLGFLQLGLLDGLYTGATALLRLAGGYAADRLGRPKAVAAAGYALSALTKLGLPLAGGSTAGIGFVLGVDRMGKGMRTAPRDALIAAATSPAAMGRAFGVHRAMDTAGALIGPLLAFAVLSAVLDGYDVVFGLSFCLGSVAVLALLFFVRQPGRRPQGERPSPRAVLAAVTRKPVRGAVVLAGVLGLATLGDMITFLAVQQRAGLPPAVLPLLPLGSAVVFMLAAAPAGRLADRLGARRVFLAGHLLLAGAYALLAAPLGGIGVAAAALALHGLFYACADGVLMAYAGRLLPEEVRASGLAAVQTAQAVARAAGAVLFGFLAHTAGLPAALALATTALPAAAAVLTAAHRKGAAA